MKPIALLLPAFLLAACGDERSLAGGVDANPNFLEGDVGIPGSARPASGVRVNLYRSEVVALARAAGDTAWVLRDSAFTDLRGHYRFPLALDGTYRIDLLVGDSILATGRQEYDASNGAVHDLSLPLSEAGSLLIDDFETEGHAISLAKWYRDASRWKFGVGDTAKLDLTPAGLLTTVDSAVTDCSEQGRCFHFASALKPTGTTYDLALIGNSLRPTARGCLKLGRADSIEVLARGTGDLNLAVWAKDTSGAWNHGVYASRLYPLTSTWTRYSLPVKELRFGYAQDTLPWSATCLETFAFGLTGAGELWLDEVRIRGADPLDLQRP